MEEIEEDRRKNIQSDGGEKVEEGTGDLSEIVLVACKDERACLQLEDCISKSPHKVLHWNCLFLTNCFQFSSE